MVTAPPLGPPAASAAMPPAADPASLPDGLPGPDWRVWPGLGITTLWLALGAWYVTAHLGWSAFLDQPADVLGSFLEGAFAPLAFLWLVIGYEQPRSPPDPRLRALVRFGCKARERGRSDATSSERNAAAGWHQGSLRAFLARTLAALLVARVVTTTPRSSRLASPRARTAETGVRG